MLEVIKTGLRISHDSFDGDVVLNINSALINLSVAGVDAFNHQEDEIIQTAVLLYCRWIYNQMDRADEWLKDYTSLRDWLSMSSEFRSDDNV